MYTAIVCPEGQHRLTGGGTDYEGRVEYCKYGVWGTICDVYWSREEAEVVCHVLGFPSKGKFSDACIFLCVSVSANVKTTTTGSVAFSSSAFGRGDGPIAMSHLKCTGNESLLEDCPSGSPSSCSHSRDAGVRCLGKMADWISSLLEN